MTRLSPHDLLAVAAHGNLAPSVHNTQPTRWRLADDGALWLLADPARRLAIGDPQGRDLAVSVGAALEATRLALRALGLGIGRIDRPAGHGEAGLSAIARLELAAADAAPIPPAMHRRMTWRRAFAPAATDVTQALGRWAEDQPDLVLVSGQPALGQISDRNEKASLAFYRNDAYRDELLSWLRLSRRDPGFGLDGLSAPALGMSALEAAGARFALRRPLFGLIDRLGLLPGLISEARRTLTASAVLLFHRPDHEDPLDTGQVLYRHLLALAGLGFQAWPMSVLADDPETRAELSAVHDLPAGQRLITAWRVGLVPPGTPTRRERLPAEALVG